MDTENNVKNGLPTASGSTPAEESVGFVNEIINEIVYSPINLALVAAIVYLLYKIVKGRSESSSGPPVTSTQLPKLKKRDMTLQELRKYDGSQPDGRILVAVNSKIFDVTRGSRFYGPGGPYSSFAGHDASRALAMFQTDLVKEDYDDLSDLSSEQMNSIREWEEQLADKYEFVGRLLKPGEEPTNYSDDEETEVGEDASKSKDD